MPKSRESTHRVRIWLKEVDEFGQSARTPVIRQVTESVGAIPKLVIGSFWRNGRTSRPKHANPAPIESFELVAPEIWSVVRAGDTIPKTVGHQGSSHTWINRSDLPLIFTTSTGKKIFGLNANVVSARTTDGRELIIPCYEIFRSLYAGTTDLSLALLSGTWGSAEKRFIVDSRQHETDEGVHWSIDLAPGVPHSAVPYLSWLHFDDTAKSAADRIRPATVRQGLISSSAWISAEPPIVGQVFRMRARTIYLRSRNALLVTQICSIDFPIKVASLSYSIAVRPIPVGTTSEGNATPTTTAVPKQKPTSVSKPRDARHTKRFFQLPSVGAKFPGLPIPRRSARSERHLPIPEVNPTTEPPESRQVSVGKPDSKGTRSRAQFTSAEETIIEDRFQAIHDLVDELIAEGKIRDAAVYPIVRPAPADSPAYCEFPSLTNKNKPCPWSAIRAPEIRARLALVLELMVEDRFIYWIETETTNPRKGHCSLAVELVSGDSLDEGVLETLLDICAENEGVWPKQLPFGAGTLVSALARHTLLADGRYSPNMMLLAFARLSRAKADILQSNEEASGVGVAAAVNDRL